MGTAARRRIDPDRRPQLAHAVPGQRNRGASRADEGNRLLGDVFGQSIGVRGGLDQGGTGAEHVVEREPQGRAALLHAGARPVGTQARQPGDVLGGHDVVRAAHGPRADQRPGFQRGLHVRILRALRADAHRPPRRLRVLRLHGQHVAHGGHGIGGAILCGEQLRPAPGGSGGGGRELEHQGRFCSTDRSTASAASRAAGTSVTPSEYRKCLAPGTTIGSTPSLFAMASVSVPGTM